MKVSHSPYCPRDQVYLVSDHIIVPQDDRLITAASFVAALLNLEIIAAADVIPLLDGLNRQK